LVCVGGCTAHLFFSSLMVWVCLVCVLLRNLLFFSVCKRPPGVFFYGSVVFFFCLSLWDGWIITIPLKTCFPLLKNPNSPAVLRFDLASSYFVTVPSAFVTIRCPPQLIPPRTLAHPPPRQVPSRADKIFHQSPFFALRLPVKFRITATPSHKFSSSCLTS